MNGSLFYSISIFRKLTFFITVLFYNQFLYAESHSASTENQTIRVGVLKSGSVNWEIDTLKRYALDTKNNINVRPVVLGSVNALLVALQGGAVDIIVGDWVWVAKQYQKNKKYFFYPFSTAAGGLLVDAKSNITGIKDLENKKVGIAGGAEGKSWLILKAYALHEYKIDLQTYVQPKFAPPPLLNVLIKRHHLDASLNFWQFNAKLEAQGFLTILTLKDVLNKLQIAGPIPMIGWVFPSKWAQQNTKLVKRFINASQQTKLLLRSSESAWQALRPLMRAKTESIFQKLRQEFVLGIPEDFGDEKIQAMNKMFRFLQESAPKTFMSKSQKLPDDMFWRQ